ncbi:MAG: DNA adenine methylase [Bacteroidales bacterium]|nr:DNA adenine methylase [Bacteroidales bacterium]
MTKAKPFIKWAGGKGQLLPQLMEHVNPLFTEQKELTYIEPFVGGGAMLFHMLQTYPNITKAVINDINPDLIECYKTVRDHPQELLEALAKIEESYYKIGSEEERKEFFLQQRIVFNRKRLPAIENTTLFLFLNRTCFNGLYRVNKKGEFNVPFGRYGSPKICDPETILADSRLLQNVEILRGDFEATFEQATEHTFFYFDPPYRPISLSSSFTDYAKEVFNDESQLRLKRFCDRVTTAGHSFMLSNSDSKDIETGLSYFDQLYQEYSIHRVYASRNVNAIGSRRGKITEILVCNF